jgi:hypothetical protein
MRKSTNILDAIRDRDFALFLNFLDNGVKAASREASYRSHELGLDVIDGRAPQALKRKPTKTN